MSTVELPTTFNLSILLVDDNADVRNALLPFLEEVSEEVLVATSGREAIEIVKSREIGVVVLDIKMPSMTGLEAMRLMKEIRGNIIYLFITGHADTQMVQEALRLGAYDFIDKPFVVDRLLLAVRRACEKHILEKQTARILEALLYEYIKITTAEFRSLPIKEQTKLFTMLYSIIELKILRKEVKEVS